MRSGVRAISRRFVMSIRPRLQRAAGVVFCSAVAVLFALPAAADVSPDPGSAVPEPTAALAFGAGALALGWALRRKR
jgi:hypothetical protein